MSLPKILGAVCLVCLGLSARAHAAPASPPPPTPPAAVPEPSPTATAPAAEKTLARAVFTELMGIDTSATTGATTPAAQAIARRLRAAGFAKGDVQILGPTPTKQAVIARLHGAGARPPLLLLGHLDVVTANKDDWSLPPYHLTEKDGYFYGRGSLDMKSIVSLWVADLLRLAREHPRRDRDVILALTPDEEDGPDDGVAWLLAHRPELIQAGVALNEGGGGEIKFGRRRANNVQIAEKGYAVFELEARNKGGHGSLPEPDNAIVHLAESVARVHHFVFPAKVSPTTKTYFTRVAAFESGTIADDLRVVGATPDGTPPNPDAVARLSRLPFYNARLRTTCVPTQIQGGHARNALPQLARATVNCRILPGEATEDVEHALRAAMADAQVTLRLVEGPGVNVPSPLDDAILKPIASITSDLWPGVITIPAMSTGASDGRFLRAAGIPTYGVSGVFNDVDDNRAHGRDERILVQSFFEAQAFTYRLIETLVTAPATPPR